MWNAYKNDNIVKADICGRDSYHCFVIQRLKPHLPHNSGKEELRISYYM